MKMFKFFKDQRGISLIEVMVAAGMMGVVSLGVSQIMSNMSKTMRWTESKNEEMALINRFSYEMRDQQVCAHSLVGSCEDAAHKIGRYTTKAACDDATTNGTIGGPFVWNATPTAPTVGGAVFPVIGRNNMPSFVSGTKYGNGASRITLTSINLIADPANLPVANTQGTALVRMVITRQDATGKIASKQIATDIGLTVKWDGTGTKVSECFADRQDTIQTAKIQACQNIGGNFDIAQDWCQLHRLGPGAEDGSGTPGVRENGTPAVSGRQHSRAVEQSFVEDLFRRSCLGPGRIYKAGNGADIPPSCMVDTSRLSVFCPPGKFMAEVSFGEGANDAINGTKFAVGSPGDGDTMQVTCKDFCNANQLYKGFDPVTGQPKCLGCSAGEIAVWVGAAGTGDWVCKSARGNCANDATSSSTHVIINAYDGLDTSGNKVCREVSRLPKNACPSGQVITGFTTNSAGTLAPNCCKQGNGCPSDKTSYCANGYLAPLDDCGFPCTDGTKVQKVNTAAQPLVYGCEYYTDSLKITRKFPEWTCGTPADPATDPRMAGVNVESRSCYLGGDNKNHTYAQCRAKYRNGQYGRVAFFSKVNAVKGKTNLVTSGNEEDSFCLIPQAATANTFGRERTSITDSCTNCTALVTINRSAVQGARKCPSGWKLADYSPRPGEPGNVDLMVYEVNPTYCDSVGLRDNGGSCPTYGESRSYTFPHDYYLEESTADVADWPGTSVPNGPVRDHDPLPGSPEPFDAWDHDHSGCTDNVIGVTHWQKFLCYAEIGGISCK